MMLLCAVETFDFCVPNAISYTEVGLFSSEACLKSVWHCRHDVLGVCDHHERESGRIHIHVQGILGDPIDV